MPRPDWDEYFCDLVSTVATRATCDRGKSGCVVVRGNRLIAAGYVGAPSGLPHCDEAGHMFRKILLEDGSESIHCVRTVHAEQNAIAQAARYGLSMEGTTIYCSMEPCQTCAMLLISVGVVRVVALRRYHAGEASRHMLRSAGVQLDVVSFDVADYPDQGER